MKRIVLFMALCSGFLLNGQELSKSDDRAKELAEQMIERLTREYFGKVTDYFALELKEELSADKLGSSYQQIKSQYGDYIENIDFSKKITAEKSYYIMGMKFSKGNLDFTFCLNKDREVTLFRIVPYSVKPDWKVPAYVNRDLFEVHDLKIGDEMPLLAEITKSSKTEELIVTVLVHGSGPNDMDATLGPNKIFKDLAYGLASNKISSIRYNKRSYDYPLALTKNVANITIDDIVVNDAVQAIKQAREMGASKVILIGHSLGGHMAPKIAELAKPDAVILLAGNSSPLEKLILPQVEHIMKYDTSSKLNEFQYNALKYQVENLKKGNYNEQTTGPELPLGLPGKFWMSLQNYEPAKISAKQTIPYLVLNGERDYQVTPKEAKKWKNGSKHELSKTIIYPKLNHMFFAGEGVLIPAEYDREAHMDEKVVMDIVNWIHAL